MVMSSLVTNENYCCPNCSFRCLSLVAVMYLRSSCLLRLKMTPYDLDHVNCFRRVELLILNTNK